MMRKVLLSSVMCVAVLAGAGSIGARDASASLVWGESDTPAGSSEVHWARAASPEEAVRLLRAYSGEHVNVILTCRQTGWFAFVGSTNDTRHGVSCGYKSEGAALYKARMECEAEGGSCEVERVGYDDGSAVLPGGQNQDAVVIPGAPGVQSPVDTVMGPLLLQQGYGRILDY